MTLKCPPPVKDDEHAALANIAIAAEELVKKTKARFFATPFNDLLEPLEAALRAAGFLENQA